MNEEQLRPWMMKPLDEWSIVGMNHYSAGGKRRLFVAMAKDGCCITAEGKDDRFLWNRLWHQAMDAAKDEARIQRAGDQAQPTVANAGSVPGVPGIAANRTTND